MPEIIFGDDGETVEITPEPVETIDYARDTIHIALNTSTFGIDWDRVAPPRPEPEPEPRRRARAEHADIWPDYPEDGQLIYHTAMGGTYRFRQWAWSNRATDGDWEFVCQGDINEMFTRGARFPRLAPNGYTFYRTDLNYTYQLQWGSWLYYSDNPADAGQLIDPGPESEPEPDYDDRDDEFEPESNRYSAPTTEDAMAPEAHHNCMCEACKFRKFGNSSLGHVLIDSAYSTPDGGWQPRGEGNYFLGVELETTWADGSGRSIHPNMAAAMARPDDGFWFPKSDSSVSGPEFASHPATLEEWVEMKPDMDEMFQMLLHGGYRSHDGGQAGMHISFSRTAITNSRHLYRLLSLIHRNPEFMVKLSQRSWEHVNSWAKLSTYADREAREGYCDTVMPKPVSKRRRCRISRTSPLVGEYDRTRGYAWCLTHRTYVVPRAFTREPGRECNAVVSGYDNVEPERGISDRYVALNAPQGDHDPSSERFEFRLPRGTLRLDRFYKNLEWVVAMIEFTRESKNTSSVVFARYVEKHATEFPNLLAFMGEKDMLPTRKVKVAA